MLKNSFSQPFIAPADLCFSGKRKNRLVTNLPALPEAPAEDSFYKIKTVRTSKPSESFLRALDESMKQLAHDFAGPIVELLKQRPVEIQVARDFSALLNNLKTPGKLFRHRVSLPNAESLFKMIDPATQDPMDQELRKLILSGRGSPSRIQALHEKYARKEQKQMLSVKALHLADRIFIPENGGKEDATLKKAFEGIILPESLTSTRTDILRHEFAHHIEEAGTEGTIIFSSERGFQEAVKKDIQALAIKKLIPFKIIDGKPTLHFYKKWPIPSEGIKQYLRAQGNYFIPQPQIGNSDEAAKEIFAELLSAMYGGHGKILENIIFLTTGNKDLVEGAQAKNILQFFPQTTQYMKTKVLPRLTEKAQRPLFYFPSDDHIQKMVTTRLGSEEFDIDLLKENHFIPLPAVEITRSEILRQAIEDVKNGNGTAVKYMYDSFHTDCDAKESLKVAKAFFQQHINSMQSRFSQNNKKLSLSGIMTSPDGDKWEVYYESVTVPCSQYHARHSDVVSKITVKPISSLYPSFL